MIEEVEREARNLAEKTHLVWDVLSEDTRRVFRVQAIVRLRRQRLRQPKAVKPNG